VEWGGGGGAEPQMIAIGNFLVLIFSEMGCFFVVYIFSEMFFLQYFF
jgi:hypothetical protein